MRDEDRKLDLSKDNTEKYTNISVFIFEYGKITFEYFNFNCSYEKRKLYDRVSQENNDGNA